MTSFLRYAIKSWWPSRIICWESVIIKNCAAQWTQWCPQHNCIWCTAHVWNNIVWTVELNYMYINSTSSVLQSGHRGQAHGVGADPRFAELTRVKVRTDIIVVQIVKVSAWALWTAMMSFKIMKEMRLQIDWFHLCLIFWHFCLFKKQLRIS